jgi:hypothetical protein
VVFLFHVQFLLFHRWIFYVCLRNIIILFGRTVNGYPLCRNRGRFKHKELANQRFSHYTFLLYFVLLLLLLLYLLCFKLINVEYITFSLYFKRQNQNLFTRFC